MRAKTISAKFRYSSGDSPLDGYAIRGGIGSGGFGEVYFAVSDAGKEVALKRIQRNLDVELRGVQICLNLKHPNLISLWDIRTDQYDDSWVVMEYVPGPNLREIIDVQENGMPAHQIQRWFESIASGVHYLHEAGIVHRDLKPANILLDEDSGVIKIGDYGLSKFISSTQGSGQTETVGTFHYMAPEIGKGIYGKGIDIYAMGIILFEMLTGRVPFRGESSQEIIMKHLTMDADLGEVPVEFRDVIRRSLLKDPQLRVASVAEMRQYLPWTSENGHFLAPSFGTRRFLYNGAGIEAGADNSIPAAQDFIRDVMAGDRLEDGILFGPLRDSNSDNGRSGIVFIDDTQPYGGTAIRLEPISQPGRKSEPIAEVVQAGWGAVADWWHDKRISTSVKFLVLLAAGSVIILNSSWLLPISLGLALVYLVYFVLRSLVWVPAEEQTKRSEQQQQRQRLQQQMRHRLMTADWLTRAVSLTGSMILAAIVCLALNLLGLAISSSLSHSDVVSWSLFAWCLTVSVAGSWSLLALGKLFEVSDGEWLVRRVVMVILGVLVGAAALATSRYFHLNLPQIEVADHQLSSFVRVGNDPMLLNVLFFAGVFGAIRWWRQTDPTRSTQLSLWAVGLCLIWAALISHALNFAPVQSCLLVVVMSIAVQLSAPWISTPERQAILGNSNNQ